MTNVKNSEIIANLLFQCGYYPTLYRNKKIAEILNKPEKSIEDYESLAGLLQELQNKCKHNEGECCVKINNKILERRCAACGKILFSTEKPPTKM